MRMCESNIMFNMIIKNCYGFPNIPSIRKNEANVAAAMKIVFDLNLISKS